MQNIQFPPTLTPNGHFCWGQCGALFPSVASMIIHLESGCLVAAIPRVALWMAASSAPNANSFFSPGAIEHLASGVSVEHSSNFRAWIFCCPAYLCDFVFPSLGTMLAHTEICWPCKAVETGNWYLKHRGRLWNDRILAGLEEALKMWVTAYTSLNAYKQICAGNLML